MVDHDIKLNGLSRDHARQGPLIVKRLEQNFIEAMLEQMAKADGLDKVIASKTVAEAEQKRLRLNQPVHRVWHLALLEVFCDVPGQPRLDPQKIESAVLVMRRCVLAQDAIAGRTGKQSSWLSGKQIPSQARRFALDRNERFQKIAGYEGWMQATDKSLRGWVSFADEDHEELDPLPERRPLSLQAGNLEINRRLADWQPLVEPKILSESISPLFIAPPTVCQKTGRTILYGMIPLTSNEQSEGALDDSPFSTENFSDADLNEHLPFYLREGGPHRIYQTTDEDTKTYYQTGERQIGYAYAESETFKDFVMTLKQLQAEFDVAESTAESRQFWNLLNQIQVTFPENAETPSQPLGLYLKEAIRILVNGEGSKSDSPPLLGVPKEIPRLETRFSQSLQAITRKLLKARLQFVVGKGGRFDDPQQLYSVRAFVRVRRDDGCPPLTICSDYSEPFQIKAWYEPSEAQPMRVSLPDPFDKNLLKNLKPGVAFSVPQNLFNMLNNSDPKKLRDGEAGGTGGFALDWICGFNIPLITICAFIVLYIFLSLFHIIFQWLFIIKICIPFPRKK